MLSASLNVTLVSNLLVGNIKHGLVCLDVYLSNGLVPLQGRLDDWFCQVDVCALPVLIGL